MPGVGQLAQHRFGAAFVQFGTVVVYFIAAFAFRTPHAALFAFAWSAWSVLDAYRREPD